MYYPPSHQPTLAVLSSSSALHLPHALTPCPLLQEAARLDLSRLISPPYNALHPKWMKEPSPRIPLQSCRWVCRVGVVCVCAHVLC